MMGNVERGPESEPEEKIETMTFEEYAETRHETPYVYEIDEGDKRIVYFGAGHSHDPANPMFEKIKEQFQKAKPQIVFVEGVTRLASSSDTNFLQSRAKELENLNEEEVIRKRGEPGFALKLAVESGVDYECPEAGLEREIAGLLEQGFSKEDVFASYLYELVDNYHEHKIGEKAKELTLEKYFEFLINEFRARTAWEGFDYSLENLERIGRKIFGEQADIRNPSIGKRADVTIYPGTEANQTIVNEIVRQATYIRDKYMVKRINEVIKQRDRLFIVFGAGHAVMQEPAIRKLFATEK